MMHTCGPTHNGLSLHVSLPVAWGGGGGELVTRFLFIRTRFVLLSLSVLIFIPNARLTLFLICSYFIPYRFLIFL